MNVHYCKNEHEPVAQVDDDQCPVCNNPMEEIGWMETDESKEA